MGTTVGTKTDRAFLDSCHPVSPVRQTFLRPFDGKAGERLFESVYASCSSVMVDHII
jgi:hypothetical protein